MDRKELRQTYYAIRSRVTRDGVSEKALQEQLYAFLMRKSFRVVGGYMPFRDEPNVLDVISRVLAQKKGVLAALPVIDDLKAREMHYAQWIPGGPVKEGVYRIAVPQEDKAVVPDLILSPCVAVDERGYRLGNGGGFFDRYLMNNRGIECVAIAYEELILSDFQTKAHDMPMQWIATQTRVVTSR